MGILDSLRQKAQNNGVFGLIAGPRLSGKSTLAGTLPGKTFFLQAAGRETGSASAAQLAAELGNHLDVGAFNNLNELRGAFEELAASDYDNVYIDGITAITAFKFNEPDIQKLAKKNTWDAFREISTAMEDFIMAAKRLAEEGGKNVFMTLAMKEKYDSMGNLINLEPECKGNATLAHIKGFCPTILIPRVVDLEDGSTTRELVTKTIGPWTARVDSLLDHQNPGIVPVEGNQAGLAAIINLIKGDK